MIYFYLLWTLSYILLLRRFAEKWPNQICENSFVYDFPPATLLIPVRNEVENLESLIGEIMKINYPKLQILLVDDQSEDGTFSVLKKKTEQAARVRILKSPGVGKKAALEFGVENADTELIICSDADCKFFENWANRILSPFVDPGIQLVCGPVMTEKHDTYFQRFQQIEWASILLLTQFFFQTKSPLICSGANLAYRKSAFLAVNGYDQNIQHLSGDDEFLLKKMVGQFGEASCVYLPFYESLVLTQPQRNFSDLVNQRVRWAGKWRIHRDRSHAVSAVGSFFIQVVWMASVLLLGLGLSGVLVFFAVWVGKVATERAALGKVLKSFGLRHSNIDFIKTGLTHPFYVLTVAIGALRGKFDWKGREN